MNLKEEISKNIQLVFDNEKSFLSEFVNDWRDAEIDNFYMGSNEHLLNFLNGWGNSMDRCIKDNEFQEWKSTLDNKEGE